MWLHHTIFKMVPLKAIQRRSQFHFCHQFLASILTHTDRLVNLTSGAAKWHSPVQRILYNPRWGRDSLQCIKVHTKHPRLPREKNSIPDFQVTVINVFLIKKKSKLCREFVSFFSPLPAPSTPCTIFTFCHYTYGPVFLTLSRTSSFSKELQMTFLLLILKTLCVNSGCHLTVLFVVLVFLVMCPYLTQSGCILALCIQSCHQKAAPYLNLL